MSHRAFGRQRRTEKHCCITNIHMLTRGRGGGYYWTSGDCIDRLAHTSTQHNEKKSNSAKINFVVEQSEVGEPH